MHTPYNVRSFRSNNINNNNNNSRSLWINRDLSDIANSVFINDNNSSDNNVRDVLTPA